MPGTACYEPTARALLRQCATAAAKRQNFRWSGPKIALRGKRRPRCVAVDITVLSMRTELPPIYRRFGYVETGIEEFHPSQPLKSGVEYHSIVMSKKL